MRSDGSTVACSVLRDPVKDHDGLTAWKVRPLDSSFIFKLGDRVTYDLFPRKAVIEIEFVSDHIPEGPLDVITPGSAALTGRVEAEAIDDEMR